MKGHKEHHHKKHHEHRMHRETGGVNDAELDLKDKPEARTNARKIDAEAEERRHGGRAKRKAGGMVHHKGHVAHHHHGEVKHVGCVEGEHAKHHAGRKPRKSGGRATSDANPFTSAKGGTPPKGRRLEMEMD